MREPTRHLGVHLPGWGWGLGVVGADPPSGGASSGLGIGGSGVVVADPPPRVYLPGENWGVRGLWEPTRDLGCIMRVLVEVGGGAKG